MVANPGTHCAKTERVQQSPEDITHPAEIIQNDISGLPQQNQLRVEQHHCCSAEHPHRVEQSDDNATNH